MQTDEVALNVMIAEGIGLPTAVAASQCEPVRQAGDRHLFDVGLVLGVVVGLAWLLSR